MRRVAQPTVGDEPRKLIAIRLDAKVLVWLRNTAEKISYQSLVKRDIGRGDEEGELAKPIRSLKIVKV